MANIQPSTQPEEFNDRSYQPKRRLRIMGPWPRYELQADWKPRDGEVGIGQGISERRYY